ncbi:hypothetical protein NA78x_000036 [Anatilimnocola sp. NA78]|uniref:hypothetical protein n=1 Tax=Anatilimnocola sp. NA78 TaxID=3415683 RepID=UPI003CE4D43F
MTSNRAPLIVAIALLLLPVLYVGSYLAMVVPEGIIVDFYRSGVPQLGNYRLANNAAARVFYPLEQIDRKVRPGAWEWTGAASGFDANTDEAVDFTRQKFRAAV